MEPGSWEGAAPTGKPAKKVTPGGRQRDLGQVLAVGDGGQAFGSGTGGSTLTGSLD